MNEQVLNTIVSSFVKSMIEESFSIFNDSYSKLYDEAKQFIGGTLREYLEGQKDKYRHVKTILHGSNPVPLYDIYFPLKVTGGLETYTFSSGTSSFFQKYKYTTIIGTAGSGKSTLVKNLFLKSIQEKNKIPLLIELRYFNEEVNTFEEYILKDINLKKIVVNNDILDRFLDKGKFVFFLDGFDEMSTDNKYAFTNHIASFIERYPRNNIVITSRPYSSAESLPRFSTFKVQNLKYKNNEVDRFINIQLKNQTELANKIIESLKSNEQDFIDSFLKNPLLLSLYILTFQKNASVPKKKYIFYRRVFEALFSEHDSRSKIGYIREKKSGLSQEQLESILKIFSYISFFEGKITFEKEYLQKKIKFIQSKLKNISFELNDLIFDLQSAISLWIEDGGVYSFAHKSIHEYFAALFISEINASGKEEIYRKITDNFSNRNFAEVENFLSLLEEMDVLDFSRYYIVPLAKEMKQLIDFEDETKCIDYLSFLLRSIDFQKRSKILTVFTIDKYRKNIYLTNKAKRSMYLHSHMLEVVENVLQSCVEEEVDLLDISKAVEVKQKTIFTNTLYEIPVDLEFNHRILSYDSNTGNNLRKAISDFKKIISSLCIKIRKNYK